MTAPTIARKKPVLVEVREGKSYFWCACGLSRNQPFCDGSHKTTDFEPLRWTATRTEEKLICCCKHTNSPPFCDGTHNQLSDEYESAKDGDGAGARLVDFEPVDGGGEKASLDNGCYVIRVPADGMREIGNLRIYPVIDAAQGSRQISQYSALLSRGESPLLRYPGSDVALFMISGEGTVRIGGREFSFGPETGVCIKPGEGFSLTNESDEPVRFNISVCPHSAGPEILEEMPPDFDDAVTDRVRGVDTGKQEAMGDRFFQVLLSEKSHGTPVTQFIGVIPQSRAAHHRHLYEETLTILSGEGYMWTDDTKCRARAGDTIFLPLKQAHSLECTSPEGMRLIGLFYPSMSPAINY